MRKPNRVWDIAALGFSGFHGRGSPQKAAGGRDNTRSGEDGLGSILGSWQVTGIRLNFGL
jgi:hypothetical protein